MSLTQRVDEIDVGDDFDIVFIAVVNPIALQRFVSISLSLLWHLQHVQSQINVYNAREWMAVHPGNSKTYRLIDFLYHLTNFSLLEEMFVIQRPSF